MTEEKNNNSVTDRPGSQIPEGAAEGQVPLGVVAGDKIAGDKIAGDKITAGKVEGEAVALGSGAKASIFKIDIRLLPVVLVLLALIGALAYFLQQTRAKPDHMEPGFNVAIAEFQVENEAGEIIESDEGRAFGDWLYGFVDDALENELQGQFDSPVNIWQPEYTGAIAGESKAEREEVAKNHASDIRADIIIYGVVTVGDKLSKTTVEFFVNDESFNEGQDIRGRHDFGGTMRISNPFQGGLNSIKNPPLTTRTTNLSLLAIGLAYYSIDDFAQAIAYLERANNDESWGVREGKQVVKMLLGNAYARLGAIEDDPSLWPTAEMYYDEALGIDNEYARAIIGKASVDYAMALGEPGEPINEALMKEAEEGFERALQLRDEANEELQAELDRVNVQSKVNFGLGQIYMMRYAEPGNWLERAKEEFDFVIADFEGGNESVRELAAHAYAKNATIADYFDHDPDQAIAGFSRAAELASPFFQGVYYGRLGDVYAELCDIEQAIAAYDNAYIAYTQISHHNEAQAVTDKQDTFASDYGCS